MILDKGRKNISINYTDPSSNNRSMESVLNKYRVVIEEMQNEMHEIHGRKLAADERIMKIERDLEESQISLKEKNFELNKLRG